MPSVTAPFSRRQMLGVCAVSILSPWSLTYGASNDMGFQLSWIKSIQYGGYFAGLEIKSFARYGINASFVSGGPNIDPIANVAAGQFQLGDRPSGPLVVARERGMPLKIIANVFQRSPMSIMSLASKPVRSVQDLKGKTIAVATSSRPLVLNLLREAGVDPSSVNIVPSSPDPSALVSGQIDAYSGYSTNQGVMLETRGVKIFSLNASDLGMPETAGAIYGRQDYLDKNREQVVSFLKGAVDGWTWALANPEKTARLMVDKYGAPGLDYNAQLAEIKASAPYLRAARNKELLALDLDLYSRIIEMYRKVGMVKSNMSAADLCDSSFINAALAA
ncbi:ABC transporter substrate-binding protein [Burkholderia gladioli]|uniref:ABC transporter substrate-binding protein n=1 Tax=Burkholderia gladioli TaxID=28095 RepID=UPI001642198F|nr:ABC transporter substrate-binding protein [Burkholderia gladioli]